MKPGERMDIKKVNTIGGDPAALWYYISKGRAIKALLGKMPIDLLLDGGAGVLTGGKIGCTGAALNRSVETPREHSSGLYGPRS